MDEVISTGLVQTEEQIKKTEEIASPKRKKVSINSLTSLTKKLWIGGYKSGQSIIERLKEEYQLGPKDEDYVRNHAQHLADTNIKKFIYSSSSSVYGDAALPMKEESLLKPVSPYGVTKLAGENLCYLYYKNYGIPTVSLRYFTVYGPRQRPDMAISKFIKAIYMGEEVKVYGDGNQMRDFTYVDDAVNANILASESHIEGGVFNIGGGCKISINELINKLLIILESNVGVRYIEKQKGDVKHTLADMSKAKGELKWEPKIDIDKGLLNYIEWLKNTI